MQVEQIKDLDDCQKYVEGYINDYTEGIIDKHEFMEAMKLYTFWIIDKEIQ